MRHTMACRVGVILVALGPEICLGSLKLARELRLGKRADEIAKLISCVV